MSISQTTGKILTAMALASMMAGCESELGPKGLHASASREVTLEDDSGENSVTLVVSSPNDLLVDEYLARVKFTPIYAGERPHSIPEPIGVKEVDWPDESRPADDYATVHVQEIARDLSDDAVGYRLAEHAVANGNDDEGFRAGFITYYYYSTLDCATVERTHIWYSVIVGIDRAKSGGLWGSIATTFNGTLLPFQSISGCAPGSSEVRAAVTSKKTHAYQVSFSN